ncbi:MAG: endopeptidase La [Muribaculaceae bacterium]|nr:endopeptidase La [Muribaculaceae bacterium]
MKKNKFEELSDNISSMNPMGAVISDLGATEEVVSFKMDINNMPLMPLRGVVPFQFITFPLPIGRESSLMLCTEASQSNEGIMLVAQKDAAHEDPFTAELYDVGVVCKILKIFNIPDGGTAVFLLAGNRARIKKVKRQEPYMTCEVELLKDSVPQEEIMQDKDLYVLTHSALDRFYSFLDLVGMDETREIRFALDQFNDPVKEINYICANAPIDIKYKQELLETDDYSERITRLMAFLDEAYQLMSLKVEIQQRTQETLSRQQKEAFLQQQIRTIQDELGENSDDDDIKSLRIRAAGKLWSEETEAHFRKELAKLQRLNVMNPEYSVQYAYLDNFLNLPWEFYTLEEYSLDKVEKVLNKDHYGLDKVKDRILEHIAVLKLRGDLKAPILCLFGPPGVGKTSLGESIAKAMGREYARISLGGLHDESEIRGHRKTYIGAMPGRIITALLKCETGNPVIVLDEIDKIGKDFKGDPSSALLEVLDPEQNMRFHDNYLDADYDLSKILFIATANSLSTISAPLLDRMEVIDISGYIDEEKVEIAKRHLIPKELEANGFEKREISFKKSALLFMINNYTRESGVRQLEKNIASILRKLARKKASGQDFPKSVDDKLVLTLLGKEKYTGETYENNDFIGVVTGLAWTSAGGEILFIESSLSPGKGKLSLTGNLGDVMKESATIALQYLKSHSELFGIDSKMFENNDVHIHVPEGAIPKDGPSAGVTMATSLASSFTGRKVRSKIAMTGEITLRGKVLPVGGIKEKILAAKRAGITDIILSVSNKKDIDEINDRYLKGLNFHYVNTVKEVFDFALL